MPIVALAIIVIWFMGSCYMWREYQAKYPDAATLFDLFDEHLRWCLYIGLWPVTGLLFLPVVVLNRISKKLWLRVHRSQLIQKELSNSESVHPKG